MYINLIIYKIQSTLSIGELQKSLNLHSGILSIQVYSYDLFLPLTNFTTTEKLKLQNKIKGKYILLIYFCHIH